MHRSDTAAARCPACRQPQRPKKYALTHPHGRRA
jgi:hypothetical protein